MSDQASAIHAEQRRATIGIGVDRVLELLKVAFERERRKLGLRRRHHDILQRCEEHLRSAFDRLQANIAREAISDEHISPTWQDIAAFFVADEIRKRSAHEFSL